MERIKKFFGEITVFEYCLWGSSAAAILAAFLICGASKWLLMLGSLLGVTALIFIAKGNVVGQFLIVAFSVFYGVISYYNRYYGEMITYLCMSAPCSIVTIITWLRHPYQGKKTEVEVNKNFRTWEYGLNAFLSSAVTVGFFFLLRALGTANLITSTVSVFTSFFACYLLIRRVPYYALSYAVNDVVLIVLWSLAAAQEIENICMVVCFTAFLANDLYGFSNWLRLQRKQKKEAVQLP